MCLTIQTVILFIPRFFPSLSAPQSNSSLPCEAINMLMNVHLLSQVVRQHGTRSIAGIVLRWDRWSACRVLMSPCCLLITKVNHFNSPLVAVSAPFVFIYCVCVCVCVCILSLFVFSDEIIVSEQFEAVWRNDK